MSLQMPTEPETLLILAKAGCGLALGRLLARHRNSLAEQASGQLGPRLRVKLDVEDLLQEVSLEAYRDIRQFRGSSEAEFLAWLRQILNTIMLNQVRRYYGTRRRDLRRERRMEVDRDASSRIGEQSLIAPYTSPTQQAVRHERVLRLAEAVKTLPELYRQVVSLRNLEGLSFSEVARRMERTEDSVKNLWVRALRRLRGSLGDLT
jgi:RNA polymerase sigma-70 factor (ECF subfamily)